MWLHFFCFSLIYCATLAAPHCTALGKVRVNFSSLSLVCLSSLSSLVSSRLVYWGWPFTPRSLITSKQRQILTWNFQGMFLRVKEHHSRRQEWPCHPCLWSGTLNVLQVPPFLTSSSWHTSNWDIVKDSIIGFVLKRIAALLGDLVIFLSPFLLIPLVLYFLHSCGPLAFFFQIGPPNGPSDGSPNGPPNGPPMVHWNQLLE